MSTGVYRLADNAGSIARFERMKTGEFKKHVYRGRVLDNAGNPVQNDAGTNPMGAHGDEIVLHDYEAASQNSRGRVRVEFVRECSAGDRPVTVRSPADWNTFLAASVADLLPMVALLDNLQDLQIMLAQEAQTKNRGDVLVAISRRIGELQKV